MKVALLGFAQAGKRTLFSLLTGRDVQEGGKEFESVEGQACVRDPRVDAIAEIVKPRKTRYAETTFILCPDVRGESSERHWLETARRCDLLCMVVRAFSSESVYHPRGSVDPDRDRANLETEIFLADLELIETRLEKIKKEKKASPESHRKVVQTPVHVLEEKTLLKCKEMIEAGRNLNTLSLEPPEIASIKSLGLLTLMPVLWTYNVDETEVRSKGNNLLKISCLIEREIMSIEDLDERKEYLKEMGLTSTGLERMSKAVHNALGLVTFYTTAGDEVAAWTVRKGTAAPAAAGKVHSDMERGFIRVEIIKYDDLIAAGSEVTVKGQGKALLKGKDYVIEDGDICFFRFSV